MKAEWNDPEEHNHTVCPNCGTSLSSDEILWDWDAETQSLSDYFGFCPHCAIFLDFSQDRNTFENRKKLKDKPIDIEKRRRQVRDALNKTRSASKIESCAEILEV